VSYLKKRKPFGSRLLFSRKGLALSKIMRESFEERPILLKFKEGEKFNHRNTIEYFED